MTDERDQRDDDPHQWLAAQFGDGSRDAAATDESISDVARSSSDGDADGDRDGDTDVDGSGSGSGSGSVSGSGSDDDDDEPVDTAGPVPPRSAAGGAASGFVWGLRPRTVPAENGVTENGVTENGVAENGVAENGVAENGVAENGVAENGVTENGVTESDVDGHEDEQVHQAGPATVADQPVNRQFPDAAPSDSLADIPTLEQVLDAPSPRRAAREAAAKEAAAREAAAKGAAAREAAAKGAVARGPAAQSGAPDSSVDRSTVVGSDPLSTDPSSAEEPSSDPAVDAATRSPFDPAPPLAAAALVTDSQSRDAGFSPAEPLSTPSAPDDAPSTVSAASRERTAPLFSDPSADENAAVASSASPSRSRAPMSPTQRLLFIVIGGVIVIGVVALVLLLTRTIG